MRVSELRLVKLKDVDLGKECITVRNAKNHKGRAVPIHPSLASRCEQMKELIHADSHEGEYFFMIRPGQAMPLANVYKNFRRYLDKAGSQEIIPDKTIIPNMKSL